MKFKNFSKKQIKLLTWWCKSSKYHNYDSIICDGAVRSGKTVCMSLSFILWATSSFNNTSFGLCGKTIASLRRNVIIPLTQNLRLLGFTVDEYVSKNYLEIGLNGIHNRFYLFGGKDESSAALIQGITLGGVMFDEVALMPRSFVEQALARCSVEGSKFWFNCNPEHPYHWFYLEWIKKAEQKNSLYLHFSMEDNPSLSIKMIKRYKSLYSGRFYDRFILGKWVQAEGLVYSDFLKEKHIKSDMNLPFEKYYLSCDYGTVNPTSVGLWGVYQNKFYRINEYYYDSRRELSVRTDEEHYTQILKMITGYDVKIIVVDPSAASFIECIRRDGKLTPIPAKNDVLSGISKVNGLLKQNKMFISENCKDAIREFALYRWDENASGDKPIKQNDHAMDDIRYFVSTIADNYGDTENDFFAISVRR